MAHVIQYYTSTKELERFNIVYIWLKVDSMAKVSTADGISIDRGSWKACQRFAPPTLWPYQEEPNAKYKKTWRQLLLCTFLLYHNYQQITINLSNLKFTSPLKKWEALSLWLRNQCNSFYSPIYSLSHLQRLQCSSQDLSLLLLPLSI